MTGEPSYLELGVPDPAAARAFYGALLGWPTPENAGPGQVDTPTLSIGVHGGDRAAHFEVFFAVADLDASLALLPELGGHTDGEVHDSPGFGRWAGCSDDQGVRFGLREVGQG